MKPTRREVISKGAIGAAVAWTAPSIVSVKAAAAASLPFAVLTALAGGFSRYVGVSDGGTYLRSIDNGDTWTAPTTPPPFTATHIAGDTAGFTPPPF
jgi:hypothetical protein